MIELSPRGSLVVPLPRDLLPLKDEVVLDGARLRSKVELHLTVFGSSIGKLVHEACAEDPRLRAAIEERARAQDWTFDPTGPWLKLRKRDLTTVVVCGRAAIAELFAALRERVRHEALRAAFERPGPPHVTLYTSDPDGRSGIGLETIADLDAALARGRAAGTGAAALTAWALTGPP